MRSEANVKSRSTRAILAVGLTLLAAAGAALVFEATRDGADLTSDSIAYINAARNLLAGRGLSRLSGISGISPMIHFPPLYSILLAGLQALGIDVLTGARIVNAFAFGITVALAGAMVSSITASAFYPFLASALVLTSPVLLEVNAWAMTEPLYIMLGMAALLCLAYYARNRRIPWLAAAAAAAGLAAVTRYAGVSLLATGCSAVLLSRDETFRRKVRDVIVFTAICAAPAIAWGARSILLTGAATNRTFSWHPAGVAQLKRIFGVVWAWILPGLFTYPALYAMAAASVVSAILAVAAWRRIGWRNGLHRVAAASWTSPGGILLQYLFWYSGMLLVTLFVVDATTPIDQRILSPMYTSLLVLAAVSLASWRERGPGHWARPAVTALVGALIVSYGVRTALLLPSLRLEQRGFTNPGWASAGSLDAIRGLPQDMLIYTNNLEALEFFYERGGTIIPFSIDAVTRLPVASYERRLRQMREGLHAGTAVLILFDRRADDIELPRALIEGTDLWFEQHDVRIYVGAGGAERLGNAPNPQ